MIAFFTGTALGRQIAAAAALLIACLALVGALMNRGARRERAAANARAVKAERQAHERMNHAETGSDMSDDQRREWLRDFAARHGN